MEPPPPERDGNRGLRSLWLCGPPLSDRRRRLVEQCAALGIPCHEDDALVAKLRRKGNVFVIAVFDTYQNQLEPGSNQVMLVRPSQFGNVGTIIRTMAAFGVRNLALIAPALAVLDPHVVRASVGAVFALRWETFADLDDYLQKHPNHVYAFSPDSGTPLERVCCEQPFTLAFGPEWPSLPAPYFAAGEQVNIPQTRLVESLNVAVAAGIALFWASRQA